MLTASASVAQTPPDRQSKQRQDGGERRHFDGPQEERDARRALFRMTRATKSVAYSAREVVTFRGGTVEFDVWGDPCPYTHLNLPTDFGIVLSVGRISLLQKDITL